MKKARINAMALNEDTPWKEGVKALKSRNVHLIFASPEFLLRNANMKKFYVDENFRTRVFGLLVDEAHVIHEWLENFRKDFAELKTLRVILGGGVPCWAFSATFTDAIFKTVYKTLSFGTSRSFWGIDVGIERPNLIQLVYPMHSPSTTFHSLIQFIPAGAETADSIPKTIIIFHSVQATRDACLAIQALLPRHLHNCIQPFASPDEESTKSQRLKNLQDGAVRVLCCTIAAGMGCDIPDIEVAIIYGVDSFVSFVQKGGRAGRDGKIEAKMVWLVEDWMFEDDGGTGGKRAQERRAKVDPMASEYISRQRAGVCLREFMNQVLRPDPHTLNLPGFSGQNPCGLDIVWVVDDGDEGIQPKAGKCCSAKSCHPSGADSDSGDLADTDDLTNADDLADANDLTDGGELATDLRHGLILNILKPETSAAREILGPPPGRRGIRCSKDEREIFHTVLEQFRTDRWAAIHETAPMLSRHWVIGEGNTKKLVENARRVINTPREKIDRRWVRALIDTVSDDATVDELSHVIREFHSGFFTQRSHPNHQAAKQQKISTSGSQRRPLSPATSTSTQDPCLDPDYLPSQHHDLGARTLQGKRKRPGKPQTIGQVCIYLAQPPHGCHLKA